VFILLEGVDDGLVLVVDRQAERAQGLRAGPAVVVAGLIPYTYRLVRTLAAPAVAPYRVTVTNALESTGEVPYW
jgi:hypothetical protein